MTLQVGVIGAGRIGKLHAENLATRIPDVKVVAIADVHLEAARQTADQLRIPVVSNDYQDILHNREVEAVIICSSTDTHSLIIGQAAEAGKHIFCEKPIDLDLKKIDLALSMVNKAGVKFQVGFNRRFDPNFSRIRQAVLDGTLGDVQMVHITSRDPAPPPIEYVKVSGGLFLDMMIHDFDMARFLVGAEVEEVYALGAVKVNPKIGEAGDVDTAVVTLKFANGVLGTINNSRQAVYGYDQRAEVFGSQGMASASNNYPNQVNISTAQYVQRDLPLHFFLERYNDSYIAEIRAFVQAIQQGSPIPVTGEDGRAPVVIGLAAKRSLQEGRPIKLSEL
jgi:myo-inositol 2-dehydrogenase/D-chiro-inositol 1-dehydrogenase